MSSTLLLDLIIYKEKEEEEEEEEEDDEEEVEEEVQENVNQKHTKKENMSRPANPAKPIVDALLQRFLPLAGRRIDTAQAQVFFGFVFV